MLYGSTIEPADMIGRAGLYPAAAGLVRVAAPRGRAEARPTDDRPAIAERRTPNAKRRTRTTLSLFRGS
jgi:hypothetical protein